jgi:ATP/maltotriose-dependent transcriptional regulator MalT
MADDEVQLSDAWLLASRIARGREAVAEWKQALAGAIEVAVSPDAAGVFLCTLGNMLQASYAMAPREHARIAERLLNEFLPRAHREGIDTPWSLLCGELDVVDLRTILPLRTELLAPAGFANVVSCFLRSSDGMVAGWLSVFLRSSNASRRAEILPQLSEVARDAEQVIRSSIEIASAVGARFPKISPDPLSDREIEIARMAASGLSDLNIAKQLAISEGTVGRHLHNIYRKLGIRSRIDLTDLLCMPY